MKKFLIIWAGELLSTIGSGLTAFGLGVYVYQQTGMPITSIAASSRDNNLFLRFIGISSLFRLFKG